MNDGKMALTVLLSHWRRHPVQFLTLIIGLATATALWSGIQAINGHAKTSYGQAVDQLTIDAFPYLISKNQGDLDQSILAEIRASGVAALPLVRGRLTDGSRSTALTGIDLVGWIPYASGKSAAPGLTPGAFSSDTFDLAAWLRAPGQIWVAPEDAQTIRIALEGLEIQPTLVVNPDLARGQAFADIRTAQRALALEGRLTHIILPETDTQLSNIPYPWRSRLALETPLPTPDPQAMTASFHLNLTAFGLLAFLVGLLIVYATIGLAFEQRLSSIRTLLAIGCSRISLLKAMATEFSVLALVAGIAGLGLGYLLAANLLPGVSATLSGLYGAAVPGTLTLKPIWLVAGLLMSLAGVALSGGVTLLKVRTLPVLTSSLSTAWTDQSTRQLHIQAVIGLSAWAGAILLDMLVPNLIAAFTVMALVLIGAALILPYALARILGWFGDQATMPLTQWIWQDARTSLSGLSLALMAMLVALSANVGVGGMVDGFRDTFTDFLEERLAAEVYLQASTPLDAEIIAGDLLDQPHVSAVLPQLELDILANDEPASIVGFADHATFRETWTLLKASQTVWNDVSEGRAVLISEQLSRRAGLGIGDPVTIHGLDSPQTRLVAGIFADYGNLIGQVRINIDQLRGMKRSHRITRLLVRTSDPDRVMVRLAETHGLTETQMIDQTNLKAFSYRIFDQTFAISTALRILTLLVAGFSLWAGMVTMAESRLSHLAPVWALGTTRSAIARFESLKVVLLTFLTAIASIPLGIGVTWILVARVQVQAFGWQLPLGIFPSHWVTLTLTAVGVALFAALWPALRLARTSPARLTQVFAHER